MRASLLKPLDPFPAKPYVLLTGFDAFGGDSVNPSWLAVQALDGLELNGHTVVAAQLPTAFEGSPQTLAKLLKLYKPVLVICVGLAGGRNALSIERIAININDARIADNAGDRPIDTPVVPGGPSAYFSTLPIKAILRTLEQAGLAAEVSQTAGTFVCNHVFYSLMHALAKSLRLKSARGGFIHVPYLSDQGSPNMPLADMVLGIRLAVVCALTTNIDIAQSAGAIS